MKEEKNKNQQPSCGLYLISPPAIELANFLPELEAALGTGLVTSFQLRLKDVEDDFILEAGAAIRDVCHQHEVPFILNDKPELAVKLQADGLHIGIDDIEGDDYSNLPKLKQIIGNDMIIGTSCYDSSDLAMSAGEQGADYISFGAFFPTTTKVAKASPSPEILSWWSTYTTVPCVAIGGITPDNGKTLVDAGADFIAVISSVWDHEGGAKAGVEAFAKVVVSE